MSPDEYAADFALDLRLADQDTERNQQTEQRILGVSDIGHCREYARRFLTHEPFTDTPEGSQARAGTFYHAGVLPIIAKARPGALIEQELTVTLANGFEVLGHADLIEPDEPSVTDVKTVDDDMAVVRRTGATAQQKSQRHLYAAGAIQQGLVSEEGLVVRNIWLDRSGTPAPPHVEQEPYDPAYLDRGARWIDEVMYAVEEGTEAPKDKDAFWCRLFCPFATACRGPEATGEEEVVSDELAVAAAVYAEGADLEKEGKELKRGASRILERLQGARTVIVGSDGARFAYKSTWVGPSEIKPGLRAGHFRATVKEVTG